MTDFRDMLSAGFGECLTVMGGSTLTVGSNTAACIVSPLQISKDLRDSGYLSECTTTVELTRANAVALGVADMDTTARPPCSIGAKPFKVRLIEDDPDDPMIRIHLSPVRNG
jgi:hypothetical protein